MLELHQSVCSALLKEFSYKLQLVSLQCFQHSDAEMSSLPPQHHLHYYTPFKSGYVTPRRHPSYAPIVNRTSLHLKTVLVV